MRVIGRCPPKRMLAVIVCIARDLETMRLASVWIQAINDGRMLLLSIFSRSDRRLTQDRSHERNRFAALLADEIFIVHADSQPYRAARQIRPGEGKAVRASGVIPIIARSIDARCKFFTKKKAI